MKLSKRLVLILAPLVLYAVAAIVWVCVSLAGSSTGTGSGGGGGGIVEGDYEFVFSGSVETNTGRTFTLALTGNKDEEQTLDLTVQEMPALSIEALASSLGCTMPTMRISSPLSISWRM